MTYQVVDDLKCVGDETTNLQAELSPDEMKRLYGKGPNEEVTIEDIIAGKDKPWMSNVTCRRSLLF